MIACLHCWGTSPVTQTFTRMLWKHCANAGWSMFRSSAERPSGPTIWHPLKCFRHLVHGGYSASIVVFSWVFAKIRYTLPLFGQNQFQSKNKYKTHPRSPAIGQAGIVTDFGSKMPSYTCFFLLCLAFNWFWPTLNQSERPYIHCFFSACMRLPSLGWNSSVLT